MKLVLAIGMSFLILTGCKGYPLIQSGDLKDRETRIKSYLDQLVSQERFPGIQYVAVDKEKVLFQYATGLANVKNRTPMTLETPMMFYSATKLFTAAAMLKLEEQAELDLNESLKEYLFAVPYQHPEVTLFNMLSHTSGLPNPVIGNMYVHPITTTINAEVLLAEAMGKNSKLISSPGTTFNYSNMAYILLGKVIEEKSGLSYEEYIRKEVFEPLGITSQDISFTFSDETDVKGYGKRKSLMTLIMGLMLKGFLAENHGKWKTFKEQWQFNFPAHGGAIGTALGFSKFLQDQLQDESKLFSNKYKILYYTNQGKVKKKIFRATGICLGWFEDRNPPVMYYFHEGSTFGYVTEVRIYPTVGFASVMTVNLTSLPHKEIMDQIDGEFFKLME